MSQGVERAMDFSERQVEEVMAYLNYTREEALEWLEHEEWVEQQRDWAVRNGEYL